MTRKKLANAPTNKSVDKFIAGVKNQKRRADAEQLLEVMRKITKKEPRIWGQSIIGFGRYTYQRKNGDAFEWFNVGFSPAKAHTSVYLMFDVNEEKELLEALGPHTCGKGCLYIKSLSDVNMNALKKLIRKSNRWER